jgi:hypothetical protein
MKDTTPLANINFSAAAKPKVLTQITNIDQFKPNKDVTGVCTSSEEWALRILKPNQAVQLQELVDTDSETEHHIERVQEEILHEFKITTTNFTFDTNDVETKNDNLAKLDINTKRNKNLSVYELAHQVNKLISKSLEKATKRQKRAKKNYSQREQKHETNIQRRLRIRNNNEFSLTKSGRF